MFSFFLKKLIETDDFVDREILDINNFYQHSYFYSMQFLISSSSNLRLCLISQTLSSFVNIMIYNHTPS